MIAPSLEESIQSVFEDARERQLELVTVEHLLLVLLRDEHTERAIDSLGTDTDALREDLRAFLSTHVPKVSPHSHEASKATLGFQRIIQRACVQARNAGKVPVNGLNVIASIFSEPDSFAIYYLQKHGVHRHHVTRLVSDSAPFHAPAKDSPRRRHTQAEDDGPGARPRKTPYLDDLATNLTELARGGKLERPVGRDEEIDGVIRALCRRYKSNPILVGEPGVGKTSIVHALAHRIVAGEVPKLLSGMALYSIDIGSLVAGTKYRGDFEMRIKGLVTELERLPCPALFIDEIHTVTGAGAVSGGALDAANILKPTLSHGRIRCIGATSHGEYQRHFQKDAALTRRFLKVEVPEPTDQETMRILETVRPRLEKHHGVSYTPGAVEASVRMSRKFIHDRHMPDKVLDVLDEAAAHSVIHRNGEAVGEAEIGEIIAKMAHVPADKVNRTERETLADLERTLSRGLYGQEEATKALAAAVRRSRLGFGTRTRPIGAYLFAGPTGVGKTELARQLSLALGIRLIRFDMSEYMERHTVSRLLGAPPGYVGFEQQGLLVDAVARTPHAVLLLDEIEKAHDDIFNILLQVMDYGSLTGNSGKRTDFSHVTLIMTSNAGAQAWDKRPLGFAPSAADGEELGAVRRLFTPEFRNRLDAIVRFKPLSPEIARKVVAKMLGELAGQLAADRKLEVTFRKGVADLLAEKGFDRVMGARPLERTIRSMIVDPLVEADLAKGFSEGDRISVDTGKDGKIRIAKARARRRPVKEPPAETAVA